MKKNYINGIVVLLLTTIAINAKAQNYFFTDKAEASFKTADQKRVTVPEKYRTISLDLNAMQNFLATVPNEKNVPDRDMAPIIEVPMPNGTIAKFHIWERPVMEQGLADKFPTIKTYLGQGITDRTAVLVGDMNELGFHAMILASSGNVFIDPYEQNTVTNYIAYYSKDLKTKVKFSENGIEVNRENPTPSTSAPTGNKFPTSQCIGGSIRNYRLAVSCTGEYAKKATGKTAPTVAQTLSAITLAVNRVTGVYELEASIHFNLITNNNLITYTNPNTDPYTGNDDGFTLIGESQSNITTVIGSANFDIGHTFSTGAGGVAGLGVVCNNSQKARGVTGLDNPVGDAYYIDYVAHEIGHQFSGNHPFNAGTGSCSGNGVNSANAEPGSGTTIMAYAGICGINDVQPHSDPQFHAGSLSEIYLYSINGTGNSCAVITTTSNVAPVVTVTTPFTIPISTPFTLTGSATDANNDAITYSWEQMNVGAAFANWDASQVSKTPLFRSFPPVVSGTRFFPQLDDVISGSTTIGERLPTLTRVMNFRLTARDNKAGNGGTCFKDVVVNVNSTGGAFGVTYPNDGTELWYQSQVKTVTWNKASTNLTPFNVANVAIELSTDGGYTFPITLVASTPNDGSEDITVTNDFTFQAKIRVRALGSIFYDMSNNDFTITANPVPVKWISFTGVKERNNSVKLNWLVNEIDNHNYIVERSLDGEKFSKIGEVPASKANGNEHSYSFVDTKPFASKNFYRIKQIDKNGGYSYSKVINITIDEAASSWVVYPNPTTDKINLFCNANYNNVNIKVYDAVGKLVYTQTKEKAVKGEIVTVALNNLAKGVYSIKLQASNAETTTQKVIVQ